MSDETPKPKRGRPRSTTPKPTAAERVRSHTDELKKAGGLRTSIDFSPEGNKAAQALMEAHGYKSRTEVVNATLIKAASKLK